MSLKFRDRDVSKIYKGSQEVQKLMFHDKLVYENGLSAGTVLLSNPVDISNKTVYITLPLVKTDWSNVLRGIKFTLGIQGGQVEQTTTVDILKSSTGFKWQLVAGGAESILIKIKSGSNQLLFDSPYGDMKINKIELV